MHSKLVELLRETYKSQKESSSSFQSNAHTNESDSENNSNDILSITNTLTSVKKSKKGKSKSSFVWKYFKVIDEKDVCYVNVKKKGKDQICGTDYVHDNSTSNIISHLRTSHKIVDNKKLTSEIQQTVVEWILLDNLPLAAPRKKGFRRMMAKVDPKFCPPSDRVEEEAGEINDGNSTDSEQLNINPNLTLVEKEEDSNEEYDSGSNSEEVQVLEPHNISTKIAQVKQAICDSFWKYWGNPKHTCLLATLLDPRLKRIHPMSSHLRETTIRVCHQELENITNMIPIQIASSTSSSITSTNHYFASIFDDNDNVDNLLDNNNELDKYLDVNK
ncbi:14262_t:CDS:2, partial [Cetraspora pellucida]